MHLVIPDVVTRPEVQEALRAVMLSRGVVAATFGALPGVTNAADDIYDAAVISRAGWMMYGSKKPDEPHPWLATGVFYMLSPGAVPSVERQELPEQLLGSPGQLARMLSIRLKYDATPLTELGHAAVQRILDDAEAARKLRTDQLAGQQEGRRPGAATSIEDLSAALGMLSDARAFHYASWRDVGYVLNHETGGRADGFGLFCDFGRRCPGKFDEAEHADEWDRTTRRAAGREPGKMLRFGTLLMMADEDSPDQYKAWQKAASGGRRAATMAFAPQITPEDAMVCARRLLVAMSCEGDVVDFQAPASEADASGTVSFGATHVPSRRKCIVRFRASDLLATVTLDDGTAVYDRHLNRDEGLRVGRDLCRVHKDIPPDQTWTVTRPSAKKAVFRGAERGTELNLLNIDRPSSEMVARVCVPDSKPHQVTQKAHIAFMMDAYNTYMHISL